MYFQNGASYQILHGLSVYLMTFDLGGIKRFNQCHLVFIGLCIKHNILLDSIAVRLRGLLFYVPRHTPTSIFLECPFFFPFTSSVMRCSGMELITVSSPPPPPPPAQNMYCRSEICIAAPKYILPLRNMLSRRYQGWNQSIIIGWGPILSGPPH